MTINNNLLPRSINFDFDGTIYPLYTEVENWLERLQTECTTVFTEKKSMVDLTVTRGLLLELKKYGVEINALTWLPMNASETYQQNTTAQKTQWADEQIGLDVFNNFYAIPYGTPKEEVPSKKETMLLFDDNKDVRQDWEHIQGNIAIDPITNDINEVLEKIVTNFKKAI